MTLQAVAYSIGPTIPADVDMTVFVKNPEDWPIYEPFGQAVRATDGQIMYTGAPRRAMSWTALPFDTDTTGAALAAGVAGVKKFYEDWETARDSFGQQMVFNLPDPLTDTWVKFRCVVPWPDWSGKENGAPFINFTIVLEALGVDLSTAPAWGVPDPVAFEETPEVLGDPLVGTAGYGVAGWGVAGYGSNFP